MVKCHLNHWNITIPWHFSSFLPLQLQIFNYFWLKMNEKQRVMCKTINCHVNTPLLQRQYAGKWFVNNALAVNSVNYFFFPSTECALRVWIGTNNETERRGRRSVNRYLFNEQIFATVIAFHSIRDGFVFLLCHEESLGCLCHKKRMINVIAPLNEYFWSQRDSI